ncbi:hypothetical protein GGH91_000652 [Coemansia sp. RSA 2671]|nr:hypothetical protein GGH91_000652 [Coemansia sp. RSA 2671]
MVYKVVEYLEGRPKHSLGVDMDKHNKQKAVLAPLLLVSERWRSAALESLCDNCALDLDHSHESRKVAFPAWPADSQLAWLCKTNLVKWVSISTTLERAVADKVANEAMLQLQRHDVVAPSARKMILCLRKSNVQAPSTGNNAFFASAPASTDGLL